MYADNKERRLGLQVLCVPDRLKETNMMNMTSDRVDLVNTNMMLWYTFMVKTNT